MPPEAKYVHPDLRLDVNCVHRRADVNNKKRIGGLLCCCNDNKDEDERKTHTWLQALKTVPRLA
eukprot:COSAG02_NODE_23182_length_724_cov_1.052548_2_plen_64_part_00